MGSNINTIKQRLYDKVKAKYPYITTEQIDDELDYYFKYVKRQVRDLPKPEITLGIVGRLYVIQGKLEKSINTLTKILTNPNIPAWKQEPITLKLERLKKLQEIRKATYAKGKTYKSTKRKKQDGRIKDESKNNTA